MKNNKSPRNRTISISTKEIIRYSKSLVKLNEKKNLSFIKNKIINQDLFKVIDNLPSDFIDLLFVDPPYNLDKVFKSTKFYKRSIDEYAEWIETFIKKLIRCLKPDASIYFCGDWKSSTSIHLILDKYFVVRNRITWEREKGRGSQSNWKNNSEDIWFCTRSNNYVFNVHDVKLKRKVIAPYRNNNGEPKDWEDNGKSGFRLTYPSNIWTDISVPFWSMPENTEHPTQKPEKLLAKLILASTNPGDMVFDPFLGSGTTAVVAKKLNRSFSGTEIDKSYACLAQKRLELADLEESIQGYDGKVFWERNTLSHRIKK